MPRNDEYSKTELIAMTVRTQRFMRHIEESSNSGPKAKDSARLMRSQAISLEAMISMEDHPDQEGITNVPS